MADHEELQEGESVTVHLLAGATAGTAEHCAMFPVDTIKTNMQAARPTATGNLGVLSTTKQIVEKNGIWGLFRGVSAVAFGAAPAHAMYFATYEFCKKQFQGKKEGGQSLHYAAAGICATIVSDAILTPMDAVKQRMQLGARHYTGMVHCIKTVLMNEGVAALYAGYTTTLLMNVPYNAVYFASYESLRRFLKRGSEKEFDALAHCLAGGGAGCVASALTNPFDVAKTRLQTQGDVEKKYKGMVNALVTIWKEEGRAGYLRGLPPRMALHSTAAAICWVTYEYCKFFLSNIGVGA